MTIHLLYDNQSVRSGIECGWGFSCLVDGRILMDTGETGPALLDNLEKMDIALEEIEALVISHPHWDHAGGLEALLAALPDIPVYLPDMDLDFFSGKSFLQNANVIICREPETIGPVTTTRTFSCTYQGMPMPEHGLVISSLKGVSLITGCAHPGIEVMAQSVADFNTQESLYAVFGGFHLMDQDAEYIRSVYSRLRQMGFTRIIGTHCSGETARELSDYKTGGGDIFSL